MGHDRLDDFRVNSPVEMSSLLQRLLDSAAVLNFNTPSGASLSSTLWTVDGQKGVLTFSADSDSPELQTLVESSEAVVLGYLESIKLQFDVHDMMLVRNGSSTAIRCGFPAEMFRFQRRDGFRVRPLLRSEPTARFAHPSVPGVNLELRVIDVSIGGCALLVPHNLPPIEPGVMVNAVELELDADTHISIPMQLLHLSSMAAEARGSKLGCEFVSPSHGSLRTLQRYIDQTQKKRRMMSLDQ
jgi:hypothetical protein